MREKERIFYLKLKYRSFFRRFDVFVIAIAVVDYSCALFNVPIAK